MRGLSLTVKRLLERNDALLKHAIIVLLASSVGGLLNYLYQLLMGRMLGPERYGIFGALLSLVYVLTVPVQTIQVSTMRAVSRFQANGRGGDLDFLIRHYVKRVSFWSVLLTVSIFAASSFIAHFLRLPSIVPVFILAVLLIFQLFLPIFNGALQGLQRFLQLGVNQVANFGSKLLFGVVLVSLGLGVEGALSGIIFGSLIGILFGIFFLRDIFSKIPAHTGIPEMSFYSVYTFLAFLFITLFYNVDMLLVKRFFESTPAGYYGAASMLAKAIFFSTIPIAGAMFPKISTWNDRGNEVVTTRLLKDTLLYTGLLAGLGTLLLNLFPGFAVSLLYGSPYGESIKLVGLFSIGMFFLSLSYVMILYQLALARKKFLTFLILEGIAEVAGISLFHASLWNVVTVFTVVMALTFFSMLFCCHRNNFHGTIIGNQAED